MSAKFNPGYADPKGILVMCPGGFSVGGAFAVGTTVPADATVGYAPGCLFIDRDAAAGLQLWINEGTLASSAFKAVPSVTSGTFTRETLSIGASTAALGTNSANAAVLPAGTAVVYPTTAADDTVGVRISASDQVTGRTLMIGNGVSNKILKVYAPTGGVINGAAADAAFSSVSGKGVTITCLSGAGNTWLAW